jgi:hypothetical protein
MSPLVIEHFPEVSGFYRVGTTIGSGVAQGNGKRHHDHARESKIEIHEVSIRNMRDAAILQRSRENKKFGFMI